jgi:DedD protein
MPDTLQPQLDELRRRARRRLVGAVVLALAAAVLVPMLLESEPKPLGEDVSVRIPPVDDGKFVSKLGDKVKDAPAPAKPAAPLATTPEAPKEAAPPAAPSTSSSAKPATEAPKPPAEAATTKPAPPSSSAKNDAAPPVAKPAPAPPADAAKPAATPEPTKPAAPPVAKGAFSVQLAAFSDDKGANALAGRLKKAGHPAYTEPYTTSRGTLYRVRVGPFATRDAAEDARSKLKAEGQSGIIAQAN